MTVKQLKQSLAKLTSDFDDTEIIVQFAFSGDQIGLDNLAMTGYTKGFEAVILGTKEAVLLLQKNGGLQQKKNS